MRLNNAFAGWPAFNEMIGIGGWRGRTEISGLLRYFKDGKLVSDDKPGSSRSGSQRVSVFGPRRERGK
jgi:uncharacterized protein